MRCAWRSARCLSRPERACLNRLRATRDKHDTSAKEAVKPLRDALTRRPSCIALPRWIIPIEPAATVLTEHAPVLRDGRIAELAPRVAALACHADLEQIERRGQVM